MPLTPLAPAPPILATGASQRRSASSKQANDLSKAKWPLVGSAVYTKLAKMGGLVEGDQDLQGVNMKLVRLSLAKNKLWSTVQLVQAAITEVNPQTNRSPDRAVYNKLRSMHDKLSKLLLEFPLEVR